MSECRRPSFAHNKSAYYRKPIGQGVEGLGIRFVEVALRCMKNVLVETSMIFEDDAKEIHCVIGDRPRIEPYLSAGCAGIEDGRALEAGRRWFVYFGAQEQLRKDGLHRPGQR
jgi:hypothetical protein